MNRIVLIGNGFDKAHGLPTSYKEFIDDYWTQVAQKICKSQILSSYSDDFIVIKKRHDRNVCVDGFCYSYFDVQRLLKQYADHLELSFRSQFFERLSNATLCNWVDVENEYYSALMDVLKSRDKEPEHEIEHLTALNKDFGKLQSLLEIYLKKIESPVPIRPIEQKIFAPFKTEDINVLETPQSMLAKHILQRVNVINREQRLGIWLGPESEEERNVVCACVNEICKHGDRESKQRYIIENMNEMPSYLCTPEKILLLDFNYTATTQAYCRAAQMQLIHIHGQLDDRNNPILFGYGDELDDNYRIMEDRNDNRYLEYIKSMGYLRTDNYRQLLDFAESGRFQICIMGHSCGNSDRTLLHTLFEHKNCVSIKPFYHLKPDERDNYGDIVRNISRNFKDKQFLRARVVNQTYCESLL